MGTEAGYLGKISLGTSMVAEMGQWNISGQENDMLEDTEFEDTMKSVVPGRGDGGVINFSGNYDPTDTNGQIALRTLYETQASSNELRLYFGDGINEFWFCEDETTCLMQSLDDLGTDKSGLGKIGFSLKVSNGYMKRAVGSWDSDNTDKVTFADAGYTITKTGGTSFVTLGFTVGQVLTVRGCTTGGGANNGRYVIIRVAANILTVNITLTLEENLETGRFISIDYTLGDEILVGDDADFADGVGSWANYSGGVIAAVSDWAGTGGTGLCQITMEAANGGAGNCGMQLATTTTVGYTYLGSMKVKLLSGDPISFNMSAEGATDPRYWTSFPTGTETVFTGVIGTAAGTNLQIHTFDGNSQVFIIDDISLKRIIY